MFHWSFAVLLIMVQGLHISVITSYSQQIHPLSQGEDPGEIRAKSQSGTQQDAKRGSAVKECNGKVKVLRQRE
jgi:hypothetical protein